MAGNMNAGDYPELNLAAGEKWIKHLTQGRLGNFNGGHFSDVNLAHVLFTHRSDSKDLVKMTVWSAPGLTKPSFDEALKQTFKPVSKGQSFGPSWTNHWLKVSLTIPGYWEQYERVQFEFDPGCEAMIFTTDGLPLQGITGGYGGDRRVEHIIPPEARAAGKYDIVIEMSCNGMFGVGNGSSINPPDPNRYFSIASADLVVPNQDAWRLLWDFQTLREIVETIPGNTILQNKALVTANKLMNVFRRGDPADIHRARHVAEEVFGEEWEKLANAGSKTQDPSRTIWGIGNCHIDTAWLWPYSVTQQKVARSWSTQVDLINRYPEYRFVASQAQQWKWLKRDYPSLWDKVKEKVDDRKFLPIGGAWVEHDANMPSGEAFIRQVLYGQRYFIENFGYKCETAWLPDTFGLSGSLPQVLRSAGMKYFFTQKLSWNNINTFPHTTFNWIGIDGTQVLCHMTPVDTYTAQATVGDVNKGLKGHKNLESADTALLAYGNGDGGGGPLAKMVENLRRIQAARNNGAIELPNIRMDATVDDFFDDIAERSSQGSILPNWHGELYLEFHRGTYTSHGSIKKGNRHSEILLRDIEHAATLASFKDKHYKYPKEKLDEMWEKVLLNQFHDVLPGSAIGLAYVDAEKYYAEVREEGIKLLEEAFETLFPAPTPFNASAPSKTDRIIAINTAPIPRREIVQVDAHVEGAIQRLGKTDQAYAVVASTGSGVGLIDRSINAKTLQGLDPVSVYTNGGDNFVIRNSQVQLTISEGRIASLLDIHLDRELILEGQTGGLVMFEDRPNNWDAWDVEIHHLETPEPLQFTSVSILSHGPLRGAVHADITYGQSTIGVTISLDSVPATTNPGSRPAFKFDFNVDWHERHKFLKFELPLNIHSDTARYETQFGYVERPTHRNTTWDAAKFEVCGHKWADLSEYGYGVAYLSESKYGFACQGNIFRISLLRAATAPDENQDQGEHEFSFAVLPHVGSFYESDVPQAGYLFNSPLHVRRLPGHLIQEQEAMLRIPPFTVHNAPNVFLETVKRGEYDGATGKATIILRLYEAFGGHARATLKINSARFNVTNAYLTNVLEEEGEQKVLQLASCVQGGGDVEVRLDFRGFEFKTVKIEIDNKSKHQHNARHSGESWVEIDALKLR